MTCTRIESFDNDCNRYDYDFQLVPAGWAQLDTNQDAAWYGIWAHPISLSILTYCEGDIIRIEAPNQIEFKAQIQQMANWHAGQGGWLRIDPGLKPELIAEWQKLGLDALLA